MRSVEVQLLEAELMSSSPDYVYAWLKNRASARNTESEYGDRQMEETLMQRGSDLINLGIARYGINENCISDILKKGMGWRSIIATTISPLVTVDREIGSHFAIAALSNRMVGKSALLSKINPRSLNPARLHG